MRGMPNANLIYSTLLAMWKELDKPFNERGNSLRIREIETHSSGKGQPDLGGPGEKIQEVAGCLQRKGCTY
jgi:hypothetical protein